MKKKLVWRRKTDHIFKMTTPTGFYQFANGTTPNKKFGYSIDDQARALILALFLYHENKQNKYLNLAKIYLNFIARAQRTDGLFHNFANAEGRFIDSVGSQDCFGRTIWALGVCMRFGTKNMKQKAKKIFNKAKKKIAKLRYIRSKAYALLGILFIIEEEKNDELEKVGLSLANFMIRKFKANSRGSWQFFEDRLIYANAILPYALLSAFDFNHNQEYKKIGLSSFNFLDKTCRSKGLPAPIGFDGWYKRGGKKALFGQQPIDVCDMILAAEKAFSLTQDKKYIKIMKDWFAWFFGNNVANLVLWDQKTGGCHDGILSQGLNPNEGAESTICFHLSAQAMKNFKK